MLSEAMKRLRIPNAIRRFRDMAAASV